MEGAQENNSDAGGGESSKNVSEAILKILANQQSLMSSMAQQLQLTNQSIQKFTHVEVVLDSLSTNFSIGMLATLTTREK
ncbi:uncharacterized protein LOC121599696 isoform X2 [Anopheles merus]|uniref:uncharacterized protein LOC121591690 isoform X2 n=1 Tax=Anopheles merus TaxID=30066 RepID=UPI001BE3FFB5|nr:uncharacterized protein LOC121591690 isoform X2 [Anopheles merus]XP_041783648.1 uncharacterized protein LOC121599696 isoform X2 [Anopheles merus]